MKAGSAVLLLGLVVVSVVCQPDQPNEVEIERKLKHKHGHGDYHHQEDDDYHKSSNRPCPSYQKCQECPHCPDIPPPCQRCPAFDKICAYPVQQVLFYQDFAQNANDWLPGTQQTMIQSSAFTPKFGTNPGVGQVQVLGAAVDGPFTRFRANGSPPPFTDFLAAAPRGFATQLAIYLDTSAGNGLAGNGATRVAYSVALNAKDTTTFVQDFVFSFDFYDATNAQPPGASTRRFIISASNNSPGNPQDATRAPIAISTSGWYNFQHRFYADGNNIYCDMTVYTQDCGRRVGSWTLGPALLNGNAATPLFTTNAGYVRYGWFPNNQMPTLKLTVAQEVYAILA